MSARPLFAHTPDELTALVTQLGGKPFHAQVVRRDVLEGGVLDYEAMTSLPARVRAGLAQEAPILGAEERDRVRSRDHTTKLLLAFDGGTVETVHIPARERRSTKGATLCVSTQIGCPVACPFCASGLGGVVRNLEAHEIVEQFLRGRALGALARSVVMGIGEPLLNYQNLATALEIVHEELGLGARKVTVSTVGFPDRLRRIAPTRPRFQLAISLHTADDAQRDELVPAMAGTPVEDVLAAGDDWFERTGREVTYEVVLLAGVTDTPAHARGLARRLAGRRCTVNLIPFNPVDESGYRRPETDAVERFRGILQSGGLVATVRWSRGVENAAACGQLRIRRQRVR
jgi:23S rRNA (adenine2503-C2)-methyltransferase